jgi:hypothetical protein
LLVFFDVLTFTLSFHLSLTQTVIIGNGVAYTNDSEWNQRQDLFTLSLLLLFVKFS